jgi:hypothetical protein
MSGTSRVGVRVTYRSPSRTCRGARGVRGDGWISEPVMAHSVTSTAPNEIALTPKHGARPSVAAMAPPADAPKMRAALMVMEFSRTALESCPRGTRSPMNDCRVGLSKTLTKPSASARTNTIHSRMTPVPTSTARSAASTPDESWVTYIVRRRSKRSAMTPPHGPSRKIGRKRAATLRPSAVPEWVSCSTRNDCATVCIQVPPTEIS